ncbi:MAG: selenium cofactor biosynthesis protein YqeC [Moorellales bacterium]
MLLNALGLNSPTLVALIGAGGKTTLLYRLGWELARAGEAVVLTTTTRMYPPTPDQADELLYLENGERVNGPEVYGRLAPGKRLFVARGRRQDKVLGLTPTEVDALYRTLNQTWVLVEADGAAGKLLKGYAPHEPALPSASGLVVALAGLPVLGRRLDAEWVHRPERVAEVIGQGLGHRLTAKDLALAVAEGLRRARLLAPPGRRLAWLNAPGSEDLPPARVAARWLLARETERVVIGHARQGEAVEIWTASGPLGVAAVVLAAGTSSRFGTNKLLQPVGSSTVVERVVDTALSCPVEPVLVVLGYQAEAVAAYLGERPLQRVHNPRYREGQSTSLRAGVEALPTSVRAALVFLGDLPLIRRETVEAILAAYRQTGAPLVYPTYAGRPGHPVLIDRRLFPRLEGIDGDQGARELLPLGLAVPVEDEGIGLDVDTSTDLDRVRQIRVRQAPHLGPAKGGTKGEDGNGGDPGRG